MKAKVNSTLTGHPPPPSYDVTFPPFLAVAIFGTLYLPLEKLNSLLNDQKFNSAVGVAAEFLSLKHEGDK